MQDSIAVHLRETFGEGRYLTTASLDRDRVALVMPKVFAPDVQGGFREAARQAGVAVEQKFDADRRTVGSISVSLGDLSHLSPDALRRDWDGVFCFAMCIKMPGTRIHQIPVQLQAVAPLVAHFAGHQFTVNPRAADYAGFLVVRDMPLRADVDVIGNVWHLHKRPSEAAIDRLAGFGGLTQGDVAAMRRADPARVGTEYLWTDCAPTAKQTGLFDTPQPLIETDTGVDIETPPPHTVMQPGEGSFNDEYNFHRAATNDEVAAAIKAGHTRRAFVYVGYLPVV